MKLYIARHGRSNYNDLQLCNADPTVDVHLTTVGVAQAEALADKLKDISLDRIFVSELKRTVQTAEIVNKYHDVETEVDSRLNDGRSGFESKPYAEYMKAFNAAKDKWTVRFNDGESVEDMRLRAADLIQDLKAKDYDAVLLVTSYWTILAIVAVVQELSLEDAWEFEVVQGGFAELEIDGLS